LSFEPVPLTARSLDVAAAAIGAGYEGYVVPIRMTAEQLGQRVAAEAIDLTRSTLWEAAGEPRAILLHARRHGRARIAAIGVSKSARGAGLGRTAMRHAIGVARADGDRELVLEVVTVNAPALNLYQSLGFRVVRTLLGYEFDLPAADSGASPLDLLDPAVAARRLFAFCDTGLPWQLAPEAIVQAPPQVIAYGLGEAAVAYVDASGPTVRLVSLAVDPARRRRGLGRALMRGLAARHPSRPAAMTAMVPKGLMDGFAAAHGWRLAPISQFEMVLDLA
jgi:ribosomal protein S18 acetylase RimI-like enzyme